MTAIQQFENLHIWQEARKLSAHVYKDFSDLRDFGFKDQICRAAVSVMNNIAEGFERGSDADFIRFLYIAKGSCGEVRSMMFLATDLGYIKADTMNERINQLKTISAGLSNFIKYMMNNPRKPISRNSK